MLLYRDHGLVRQMEAEVTSNPAYQMIHRLKSIKDRHRQLQELKHPRHTVRVPHRVRFNHLPVDEDNG